MIYPTNKPFPSPVLSGSPPNFTQDLENRFGMGGSKTLSKPLYTKLLERNKLPESFKPGGFQGYFDRKTKTPQNTKTFDIAKSTLKPKGASMQFRDEDDYEREARDAARNEKKDINDKVSLWYKPKDAIERHRIKQGNLAGALYGGLLGASHGMARIKPGTGVAGTLLQGLASGVAPALGGSILGGYVARDFSRQGAADERVRQLLKKKKLTKKVKLNEMVNLKYALSDSVSQPLSSKERQTVLDMKKKVKFWGPVSGAAWGGVLGSTVPAIASAALGKKISPYYHAAGVLGGGVRGGLGAAANADRTGLVAGLRRVQQDRLINKMVSKKDKDLADGIAVSGRITRR